MNEDRYNLDSDLEAIIPAIRTMGEMETKELINLLKWRVAMLPVWEAVDYDHSAGEMQ